MITYHWPGFRLEYTPATGEAITRYPDGTWSGCGVTADDRFHARLLGITPEEHRLQHELAHHLAGALFGASPAGGCPIIWRDAHHIPQPQPESDVLEWRYTALQYHAMGRRYDIGRVGALLDIEHAGADPYQLGALLARLVELSRGGIASVTVDPPEPAPMEAA